MTTNSSGGDEPKKLFRRPRFRIAGDLAGEYMWGAAAAAWKAGDDQPLAQLLLSEESVPPKARVFLAAMVQGQVKRWGGGQRQRYLKSMGQDSARNALILMRYQHERTIVQNEKSAQRALGRDVRAIDVSYEAARRVLAPLGLGGEQPQEFVKGLQKQARDANSIRLITCTDLL